MIKIWMVALSVLLHLGVGATVFFGSLRAKSHHEIQDARVPLKQLFLDAHHHLHKISPDPLALSLGEWILNCEFYPLNIRAKDQQDAVIALYRQHLTEFRELLAAEPEPLDKVELLRKLVMTTDGQKFCAENSNMTSMFLDGCSNNEALTRYLIALLVDLHLENLGQFTLGLQLHEDSISAVYWNSKQQILADLNSGLVSRTDGSPIFNADAVPLALLNYYRKSDPIGWKDLLITPDNQLGIKKSKPRTTQSNFEFPDVGKTCFFEMDPQGGCRLPVARGERLYHILSPHRADSDGRLYDYLKLEQHSWNTDWRSSIQLAAYEPQKPSTTQVLNKNPDTFLRDSRGSVQSSSDDGSGQSAGDDGSTKGSGSQGQGGQARSDSDSSKTGEGQGNTGRGAGDFQKRFEREWRATAATDSKDNFKDQVGGAEQGNGNSQHGNRYAQASDDPYGLTEQKQKDFEIRDMSSLQRDYQPDRYGQLRPLSQDATEQMWSHMTGLPVDQLYLGHLQEYMQNLSSDESSVVLSPVRVQIMANDFLVARDNPWLRTQLTAAYQLFHFYLEAKVDFNNELRGRIRTIDGQNYIVTRGFVQSSGGQDPDKSLYVEPRKLFLFTSDSLLPDQFSVAPNESRARLLQVLKVLFFDPLKLQAPHGLADILKNPFAEIPGGDVEEFVEHIQHWSAMKLILDDWRSTGWIFLLERYGLPAQEFYKVFYDINAEIFASYAKMIEEMQSHPLDTINRLDNLSDEARHRLFLVLSTLETTFTFPLFTVGQESYLSAYLKRSDASLHYLESRWHAPFSALIEELLRADHWLIRADLDLSKYQIVEVQSGQPLTQPPIRHATPQKIIVLSPDTLWMILNLQSETFVIDHFRSQFEILKRLSPSFMKSAGSYLSKRSANLYAFLFQHHGEPLGSIAELVQKLTDQHLALATMGGFEFFVPSPFDVFFKALVPAGLQIGLPTTLAPRAIMKVSMPSLTNLQAPSFDPVPSAGSASPSSSWPWSWSDIPVRGIHTGGHRWALFAYDKSDPEGVSWQIEIDTCSRQVTAYQNRLADKSSRMATVEWTGAPSTCVDF